MLTPAAKLFHLHYIVQRGTQYYDPSYGSYATEIDLYTAGAIGGWGDTSDLFRKTPASLELVPTNLQWSAVGLEGDE